MNINARPPRRHKVQLANGCSPAAPRALRSNVVISRTKNGSMPLSPLEAVGSSLWEQATALARSQQADADSQSYGSKHKGAQIEQDTQRGKMRNCKEASGDEQGGAKRANPKR